METLFRPSSSSRWLECPGSLFLKQDKMAYDKYSIMGTAAHKIMETAINDGSFKVKKGDPVGVFCEVSGVTTYTSIDEDITKNIDFALDQVQDLLDSLGDIDYTLTTEHRIDHSSVKGFGGTIDVLIVAGEFAWVVDLKYGTAKVEAHSEQMGCYALLVRDSFPSVRYITTMIIQPRSRVKQKVRRKSWSLTELLEFGDRVMSAMERVVNVSSENVGDNLKTGKYCWYCPARLKCPAKQLEEGRKDFSKRV